MTVVCALMYIHEAPSSSHCWPDANAWIEGSMKMLSVCSMPMRSRALLNAPTASLGSLTIPRVSR